MADDLNAKNVRNQLIYSKDIDDLRILQFNGKRVHLDTPTKNGSTRCYLILATIFMQKIRYHLTFCKDIDDQRVLLPHWMREITDSTQPKVVVLNALDD